MTHKVFKNWHYFAGLIYIFFFSLNNFEEWKDHSDAELYQFHGDAAVYYCYLPSFLVHDDFRMEKYTHPGASLIRFEDGSKMPKFSFGMAILISPFFLIAEMLNDEESKFSKYGISATHSYWLSVAAIVYSCLGFFFLLKLLSVYFSKTISFFTSMLLFFGTNISQYTLVEGMYPHIYLFTIMAAILYLCHLYWNEERKWSIYIIALLLGIIALIRPSELIIALVPVFWGVKNKSDMKNRLNHFLSQWRVVLLSGLIFLLPLLPYFYYLYKMTGEFFFYSYESEGFFFGEPKILDFLFGFRKGWFVYTPLMLLAVLGFFFRLKKVRIFGPVLPITILLVIYVMSSWWCWWFGGSFGSRPMIHYYSILAIPLAAIFEWSAQSFYRLAPIAILAFIIIRINLLMTEKYNVVQIHWDSMNFEAFRYTMKKGRFVDASQYEEFNSLLTTPDYQGAKTGKNR